MAEKSMEVVALTEIPQITPLEATQVRFAGPGPVGFQPIAGATEIAIFQGLLRRNHVGGVGIAAGRERVLLGALAGDFG